MRKGRYVQSERALSETSESGDTTGGLRTAGCGSGLTGTERKNAPQTTQDKGGLIRLFYTGGRDATRGVVCRACVCEWAESPDFGLVFVGLFRALARVQGGAGDPA